MSNSSTPIESYGKTKKRDVFDGVDPEVKERTKKMMMYLIIFSVVMLFGGWVSAYVVKEPENYWVHPEPVFSLFVSNVLIIVSSILLIVATYFANRNKQLLSTVFLIATFISGVGFAVSQFKAHSEYNEMGFHLVKNKIGDIKAEYGKDYFITLHSYPLVYENGEFYDGHDKDRLEVLTEEVKRHQDTSTSLLFLVIAVHVLHLFLGLIYLIVNIIRSINGGFFKGNILSLRTQGIYWHFMGILWLILYTFLFIIY